MDFITFVGEQWLLVSLLMALIYLYIWTEGRKGGATLSIHSATRLINQGEAVVVDLREAKEYKAGHIVDALNIPHNKVNDQLPMLEPHKSKTLVLVDKLGQHAGNAGRTLKAKGFTVCRLQGGMSEWESQNLPVVTKKDSKAKSDKGKAEKGKGGKKKADKKKDEKAKAADA